MMTRFISSRSRSVKPHHLLSGYCTNIGVHFRLSPGCHFIQSLKTKQSISYILKYSFCILVFCTVFFFFLLQDLYKKYSYIRKTRPDGNCFYRAFGFAHLESLLDDSKELQKWVTVFAVVAICLQTQVHTSLPSWTIKVCFGTVLSSHGRTVLIYLFS